MSPGGSTCSGASGMRGSGSLTQLRPERMHSYISDDGTASDDFPKRAYSVGSNPVKSRTSGRVNEHTGYMDMSGSGHNTRGALDSSRDKSSSAPHLGNEDRSNRALSDLFMELDFYSMDDWKDSFRPRTGSAGGRDKMRPRTGSAGNRDSMRPRTGSAGNRESMRPRTGSGGGHDMRGDMRPRTSSGGIHDMPRPRTSSHGQQDLRKRTGSFGREGQQSMNRPGGSRQSDHRPRTATICQDSFRSRTSSMGTNSNEMRPRSSSYGNHHSYSGRNYRKQAARTLLQEAAARQHAGSSLGSHGSSYGSSHSSIDSLRRATSRTSQDSLRFDTFHF